LPLLEVFELPLVGIVALGLLLYGLVAKLRLPFRIPAVLASVLLGTIIYYFLGAQGMLGANFVPVGYNLSPGLT